MAIIYSYPEIPDVQGGDLLLISDTGAPNKPTRSVDIDDLAAYIGTVVGVGSVESIDTSNTSFINMTPTVPATGNVELTASLSASGTPDNTKFLRGDNVWAEVAGIQGSGTANYTARWTDSDTLGIGALYDNGTNVGIGTTSPGSTLPADSETATKALQLTGVSGSAGDTAVLLRSSDNSSGLDLWHNASTGDSYIDNRYSSNQGDTIFRVKTAGTPLEALRITGDGNVGIGTTSPSEKLEVVGTIKSNQVDAFAENIPSRIGRSTGQHLSLYGNPTGNYLIGVGNKNTIIGRSGQGRIVFRNDGIQFSTEATQTRSDLFIEVINGYVGVGTSSPSQKLEVAGNILVRGSNDSADGLHLKDRTFVAFSDASSVVSRFRSSAAGIFQFQDGSYNTNIVLNTNGNSYLNGGNVGIGTTTPGAKLSVNGNVKIEGTNSLLFGGSATVPIWAISSNGSDLLIDDQASNIGSVLFNNNEGVALPRLTTTQINAISSPAQGLMAYNTTLNTICFYNGSSWQKVNSANM